MYRPKYFVIQELVPPELYALFSDNHDVMWRMFDENILRFVDWARETYCVAVINTWHSPKLIAKYGKRTDSGIRTTKSGWYSKGSRHSKAGAVDMIFEKISAHDIRVDMKARNEKIPVPFITRVESGVTWLHADTKPTGKAELYFFNP